MKKFENVLRAFTRGLVTLVFTIHTAHAADAERDPLTVINSLADRIYALGETTGDVTEMIAAEVKAAEEIRLYLVTSSGKEAIFKGKDGRSPLLSAAYMGYPNVVEALLTSKLVREHIDDADETGLTPWIAAVMSMRQSLWSCNPSTFDDPFRFVPLLVTQPYYRSNPIAPYKKVRVLLEQAGARFSMEQAKDVWLSKCKHQSAEGRANVQSSTDIQETVQGLGAFDLAIFILKTQKNLK